MDAVGRNVINGSIWNTRSANNKLSNICQFFSDFNLDFLILTETWQPCNIPNKIDVFKASLLDYAEAERLNIRLISRPRSDGRHGGGVALLFHSDLNFTYFCTNFSIPGSFEMLATKCKCNTPFILVCIYRSDSYSFATFMEEFESLLSHVLLLRLPTLFGGDFNIHINSTEEANTVSFLSLLNEHNYKIFSPDTPTHIAGNTLDFLVVPSSFLYKCVSISVEDSDFSSDHFPVLLSLNLHAGDESPPHQARQCRSFRSMDNESFSSDLISSLSNVAGATFQSYFNSFNSTITSVLDKHAPFRTLQPRKRDKAPWMDQEYITQRSLRKRLQNGQNKSAYYSQKRHCAYLAKTKRKQYYSSLCDTNDQKQLYRGLNKLCGRSNDNRDLPSHNNPVDLANSFNRYFVQKVSNIRSELTVNNISDTFDAANSDYLSFSTIDQTYELNSFQHTNAEELYAIIKQHGIKTGPGDPLPAFLTDKHLDTLLPHFVTMVNLSLSNNSCDGLTEAHVVPILKSLDLDKEDFKNYRPVSLLSFISKLTERVVHSRITSYINDNDLQTASQYGYKKHHSCETLLLKLIDDILVAVDRKLGVVLLIVDLSAAFDSVDHRLLFSILKFKYHITGSALAWLQSFLCGRTQRVKIGNCLSDALVILFGVAQGSILGPLLFNLYCAGIDSAFREAGFQTMGYADDNSGIRVFPAFSALSTVYSAIPNCLRLIRKWCNKHFLKLNSGKTQIIAFGDHQFHSGFNFTCSYNDLGGIIPFSNTVKLLGVHLDSQLNLDIHTTSTVSSVNLILRNLRLIRKYLTKRAAENLVHCVVTNKLDVCNSLFLGIANYNLAKLQKCQNNALRFVLNLHSHDHISNHFRQAHWLTIERRIYFKYLALIWKCLNNKAPLGLSSKICLESPSNMLLDTSIFLPFTAYGRRAFSYLAPRLWNALPLELRTIPELNRFKASLKHFLFDTFSDYLHNVDPYTTFVFSQPAASTYSVQRRRSASLRDSYDH